MYKPSGIAVVTVALGGLALFHVVLGRDTRPAEPGLQLDVSAPRVAPDLGSAMLVHSGAWRAWRAPLEEEPAKVAVTLPAQNEPAGAGPEVAAAPDQGTPVQEAPEEERGPATTAVASGYVAFAEPAAQPATAAPKVSSMPPGQGHKVHAEPKAQGTTTPAVQAAAHAAPKAHDPASEAQTPVPAENRFGPAIFKQFDGKGS